MEIGRTIKSPPPTELHFLVLMNGNEILCIQKRSIQNQNRFLTKLVQRHFNWLRGTVIKINFDLISKKEELIELLKEERTAIINQEPSK